MQEGLEQPNMSDEGWRERGEEENSYLARRLSHEANTSIEYGEKTWTTAQTVRDLMQNHLDAETERYFHDISSLVFDDDVTEGGPDTSGKQEKSTTDFLFALYNFSKHVEDMTPRARVVSEEYLKQLSTNLSIKSSVMHDGVFSVSLFLEQAGQFSEQRPSVLYEITDTDTDESLGWIPYEALRDEPMYQEKRTGKFRYDIAGMKIVDHGSGYDSQLSALYLSSKTGKKHLRGKFGEGAKMSELHLLRHGAKMKMRSQYNVETEDGSEQNRLWQTKPQIVDGRLVSRGVEVEKESVGGETGSLVSIALGSADESFRREFTTNVDPRTDGLADNIAEFNSRGFAYPLPVGGPSLSGINIEGSGNVQFVQGLRVELATESFGYSQPWFSYDILDSSIIGGRDRNEIKQSIVEKINEFWKQNDDPELLRQLMHVVVYGKPGQSLASSGMELSFVEKTLESEPQDSTLQDSVQKTLDQALLEELSIEKGVPTLVVSRTFYDHKDWQEEIRFAKKRGYTIKITEASISSRGLEKFAKRSAGEYCILTTRDIDNEINQGKEIKEVEKNEFVEGEREYAIRKVFASAVKSLNTLLAVNNAKMKPLAFTLEFDVQEDEDDYGSQDDDDPLPLDSVGHYRSDREDYQAPIRGYGQNLLINPNRVSDPRVTDPRLLQRQIEIGLLSLFCDETEEGEQRFKETQRFLDSLVTKLIPPDSPLLRAIPDSFSYAKDPQVLTRLLDGMTDTRATKLETEKTVYDMYRRALYPELTLHEAKEILSQCEALRAHEVVRTLVGRVFLEYQVLTYFDDVKKSWEELRLSEGGHCATWNGKKVYRLPDGRYFVNAPMEEGAVLTEGEGKKREYIFNEGDNFLAIKQSEISFENYRTYGDSVKANRAGLVISMRKRDGGYGDQQERIDGVLSGHKYYPAGVANERSKTVSSGITSTAIPIEYGKDEWDNPVRVFQDIIQNHVDASVGDGGVTLTYEVERDGERMWVNESEIKETDSITGIVALDNGDGYAPSEIATMGASSKKSPLFAGKYGEGQKMVAAASLRNGLELEYQSVVKNNDVVQNWSAKAVSEPKKVVLGGKNVEKKLVAFEVQPLPQSPSMGSRTILRLPQTASPQEREAWSAWVSIIDPRSKDKSGNGGMSRYVRQLRSGGSREYAVGNVKLLLDEPGAVYENGLRINPDAEDKRGLPFGYDVPEIVTTRERNSYDPRRLDLYVKHLLAHIEDISVIEEVLKKIFSVGSANPQFDMGSFLSANSAAPLWAEAAQKLWPDHLIYSSRQLDEDIKGKEDYWGTPKDEWQKRNEAEKKEKAMIVIANLVHLDKEKLFDLSKNNYDNFARIMPTAEAAIDRMRTELLPISAETRRQLSNIVAESTRIFKEIYLDAKSTHTHAQLRQHPLGGAYRLDEKINSWSEASAVERNEHGVALAPIESAFHGKVDRGVVFNEALLMGSNRRVLAETSLHEMAHILTGHSDYTEEFVSVLYELARHLAITKERGV